MIIATVDKPRRNLDLTPAVHLSQRPEGFRWHLVWVGEGNTAEQRPGMFIVAFKTPAFSRSLVNLVIDGQCVREDILVRPS